MPVDGDRVRLKVAPVSVPWLARLYFIVRYHRSSQLVMRVAALLKRKWRRCQGRLFRQVPGRWTHQAAAAQGCSAAHPTATTLGYFPSPTRAVLPALRPASLPLFSELLAWKLASRRTRGSAAVAADVWAGRFGFLHQVLALGNPPDWRLRENPQTPLLWRFHLHYHDFLLDLAAQSAERPEYLGRVRELMHDWIDQNPLGCPDALDDAWHPACISRRLPIWLLLCAGYPDVVMSDTIVRSLVAQARFLARNLEWDIGGNHLLENLKALVMAGVLFQGRMASRWLNRSARLLARQLGQQILPHGEHFERSPMYHCLMLELVLDVRDVTRSACPELAQDCDRAAKAMGAFLAAVLHPDGGIPLLGDSSLGEATQPADLLQRAGQAEFSQASQQLSEPPEQPASRSDGTTWPRLSETRVCGGYWTFRDENDFVLFDAGPVGPDHLPAHAHSDLLTWEASLGGKRLVVDSGVFHYQADAMRDECRATEAHNVLQIDDRPLCDTWSSFRMGYRGWPSGLESGESDDFTWARASHNACRRSGVPRVVRLMACRSGGPWICVDRAEGHGMHHLSQWLHLHPDATVDTYDPDRVCVGWLDQKVEFRPLAAGQLDLLDGWYCPGWGVRQPHLVLRWTARCMLPAFSGWSIAWRPPYGIVQVVDDRTHGWVRWVQANKDPD